MFIMNFFDDLHKKDYSFYHIKDTKIRNKVLSGRDNTKNIRGLDITSCRMENILIDSLDIFESLIKGTNVQNCKFSDVLFSRVKFVNVSFGNVDFSRCGFKTSLFKSCSFHDCNFSEASVSDENFKDCYFNYNTFGIRQNCPEKGSYIGYKKAYVDRRNIEELTRDDICYPISDYFIPVIVELRITEDSKRSSATSKKCRASKCEVLSITNTEGTINYKEARSGYDPDFIYEVGKVLEVEDFDENRWNECSNGIHHFLSREDADNYI